jgi:hypothetical protein
LCSHIALGHKALDRFRVAVLVVVDVVAVVLVKVEVVEWVVVEIVLIVVVLATHRENPAGHVLAVWSSKLTQKLSPSLLSHGPAVEAAQPEHAKKLSVIDEVDETVALVAVTARPLHGKVFDGHVLVSEIAKFTQIRSRRYMHCPAP